MALEDSDKILNVAGYWTLGVGKGLLVSAIPSGMVGIAYGFMKRIVRLGERMGN